MLTVGIITAAHGIKGEVKVVPQTDNPRRFRRGSVMSTAGQALTVANVRDQNTVLVVRFREITDRNGAEALRGQKLCVPEESVPQLPKDHYYLFELEGLDVLTEDAKKLGVLTEVEETGAHDIFRITMVNGDSLLIPARKEIVREVNLERGQIFVSLPPGLKEACVYHEN